MEKLINQFINQKILIYGFGKSGKACFNYLKKKNYLNIYDDNRFFINQKKNKFFINKIKLIKINYDIIVVSPGIDIKKCSLKKYLSKNRKKIISELDIFYLNNPKNKKITITGTNGKSTTSKLLYDVLKSKKLDVRLVGNIGNPLLLEKNISFRTIFVIEASSYQIEYSKYFKTDYSLILNIAADHLERHGNIGNYVRAKFKLIKNQKKNGCAYIDSNNLYLSKELKKNKINLKIYKIKNIVSKNIINKIKNPYFYNLNNQHNLNFVIAISKKFKIKQKKIIKITNSFKELKYRQQIIFKNKKLLIMNDSKSTSFSSTINTLQSYKNIFWIVGGKFKKGDSFNLDKKYFNNISAYIYGVNKSFFVKNFKNKIRYKLFNNIEIALTKIIKDIKKSNIYPNNIIFSPSAASFDQYQNFEDRGKHFNYLLKKLNFIKKINA